MMWGAVLVLNRICMKKPVSVVDRHFAVEVHVSAWFSRCNLRSISITKASIVNRLRLTHLKSLIIIYYEWMWHFWWWAYNHLRAAVQRCWKFDRRWHHAPSKQNLSQLLPPTICQYGKQCLTSSTSSLAFLLCPMLPSKEELLSSWGFLWHQFA